MATLRAQRNLKEHFSDSVRWNSSGSGSLLQEFIEAMADLLATMVENLTTVLFFKSYNAGVISFLQISGHTCVVVYADLLADVLNLIGCVHYNISNICVLYLMHENEKITAFLFG